MPLDWIRCQRQVKTAIRQNRRLNQDPISPVNSATLPNKPAARNHCNCFCIGVSRSQLARAGSEKILKTRGSTPPPCKSMALTIRSAIDNRLASTPRFIYDKI